MYEELAEKWLKNHEKMIGKKILFKEVIHNMLYFRVYGKAKDTVECHSIDLNKGSWVTNVRTLRELKISDKTYY